ncbi:D-alanyl-D-alanine carboxypeptidase precursor [compost metagenome]
MRTVFLAFLFILAALFVNAQSLSTDKSNTYPDRTWEYLKDPSAFGWNKEKLQSLKEFIIDSANTTGMMVIQHGKVIFTYGDVKEVSYIASCRKSILSMLYGPFVEQGEIRLDQTLEQLKIKDVGGLLPIEKRATVRDLLTARSGIYHVASYQGDEYPIAPNRGTVKPGSLFLYNNWDFNLAGYVFEQQTGLNIYDALESIIAHPLQMEDWNRDLQQKEGDSTTVSLSGLPHVVFDKRYGTNWIPHAKRGKMGR